MSEQYNKRSFFKSLKGKVAVWMLVIALVPAITVGLLAYFSMDNARDDANVSLEASRTEMQETVVGAGLGNQAEAMSRELGDYIKGFVVDLAQMVATPNVMALGAGIGDANATAAYLAGQRQIAQPTPELPSMFGELTVFNASGNAMATSNEANTLVANMGDIATEAWFLMAMSPQNPVGLGMGAMTMDTNAKVMKLNLVMRIPNPLAPTDPTQAVGVLKCSIYMDPSIVAKGYADRVPGGSGRVVAYTSTGLLLADSADEDRPFADTWTKDPVETAVAAAIAAEDEDRYVMVDDSVAGYYSMTSDSEGELAQLMATMSQVTVIMEQPQSVAFASLDSLETLGSDLDSSTSHMMIILIIVLVVVVVVALVVALLLSRSITKPVSQLRDVADKVSMGDMHVTLPKVTDDEIGDLSQSFDRMVTAVRILSQDEEG